MNYVVMSIVIGAVVGIVLAKLVDLIQQALGIKTITERVDYIVEWQGQWGRSSTVISNESARYNHTKFPGRKLIKRTTTATEKVLAQ